MNEGINIKLSDKKSETKFDPDIIIKWGSLIAAILYLIGLVTVNFHLYNYGVHEFSLLKIQYILTGFLTVIPLLCGAFGVPLIFNILKNLRNGFTETVLGNNISIKLRLFKLLQILFGLLWVYCIQFIVFSPLWLLGLAVGKGILPIALFSIFTGFGLFIIQIRAKQKVPDSEVKETSKSTLLLLKKDDAILIYWLLAMGFIFIIYFYEIFFAYSIYPKIPYQYGGGAPVEAYLTFNRGSISKINNLLLHKSNSEQSIPVDKNGLTINPVFIVIIEDDFIVLQVPNSDYQELKDPIEPIRPPGIIDSHIVYIPKRWVFSIEPIIAHVVTN